MTLVQALPTPSSARSAAEFSEELAILGVRVTDENLFVALEGLRPEVAPRLKAVANASWIDDHTRMVKRGGEVYGNGGQDS